MLLPHVSFDWQSAEQPSPDAVSPTSHCSVASLMLSPQRGSWQFERHLSGASWLSTPSSQLSNGVSTTVSPHFARLQFDRHAFGAFELFAPSSHSSPTS